MMKPNRPIAPAALVPACVLLPADFGVGGTGR